MVLPEGIRGSVKAVLAAVAMPLLLLTASPIAWGTPQADSLSDIPTAQLQTVRLDMVDRAVAPQRIRIMAYILGNDASGMALLRHLIAASRRGVKVQLLLDGIGPGLEMPIDDELIAAIQTLAPRFEISIFHPKYNLLGIRHRMHDKLFLIEDTAIIGSSSTWDPSVRGALLEKDILVHGDAGSATSVLSAMQRHFEAFWNAPQSVPQNPLRTIGIKSIYENGPWPAGLNPSRIDSHIAELSDKVLEKRLIALPVSMPGAARDESFRLRLTYIHDSPDKQSGGSLDKMLQRLATAKHEILIVSPYMILVPEIRTLLREKVMNEHIRVTLLTTSITSMSAEFPPIAKAYADDLPALAKDGIEVREFRARGYDRMLHAKLVRIDHQTYFVGSFNFDPLSARYNTENGLWIETDRNTSSRFVQDIDRTIEEYLGNSEPITDGEGNLLVDDPYRCDVVNCDNPIRIITPLVRDML